MVFNTPQRSERIVELHSFSVYCPYGFCKEVL